MTVDKNFKKKVRERMAKTGERYTTARAALLAGKPVPKAPPVDVSEVLPAGAHPSFPKEHDEEDYLSPDDVDRLTKP